MIRSTLLIALAVLQVWAGVRIIARLIRTAGGQRIPVHTAPLPESQATVIVPVLNECHRLGPCLEQLIAQPDEFGEILVVDGGSEDGTQQLVKSFRARDCRVRLLDATPVPSERNGKAHGLQVGLDHADPNSAWILTVDADVRLDPAAGRSLLAHLDRSGDAAVSVATRQRLSGAAEGLLHPAMLTTLVYRYGIPGQTAHQVDDVQANGQCFLARRSALAQVGGFSLGYGSVCEDVTIARAIVAGGHPVSFAESEALVETTMYENWRDAWRNWSRSLPMRDQYSGIAGWLGLLEVTLVQALPLPLLLMLRGRGHETAALPLRLVTVVLVMNRLGVLAGTARAYTWLPWTYWLSPALDVPVAVQLWRNTFRRRHRWRGRLLVRDHPRTL
jgi:dolichol-phosphate mannosyltransferase